MLEQGVVGLPEKELSYKPILAAKKPSALPEKHYEQYQFQEPQNTAGQAPVRKRRRRDVVKYCIYVFCQLFESKLEQHCATSNLI